MDYSFDSHSYRQDGRKHDSFLSPSSHDVYGYSRNSRSSSRLDAATTTTTMNRNKSVSERERRPYHGDADHRSKSSVRLEESYPNFSRRGKSMRHMSWPPPASVEDEDEAAAKEYPKRRIPKVEDDEVCMPGTVDQNPVFIELESHDRRFVLLPQDGVDAENSQSNQRRKRSERQPSLRVDVDEPNLFARRQPSPYAFSRTPQTASNKEPAMFPDQPSTKMNHGVSATPTSARKIGHERRSRNANSSSDERQTDDSDLEHEAVTRLRERKGQARVSFTESASTSSSRPHIKRFSSDYTSPTESRRPLPSNGPSVLKSAMKPPRSTPTSDDEKPARVTEKEAKVKQHTMPVPTPIPQHVRSEGVYGKGSNLREAARQDQGNSARTPPASPKLMNRTMNGEHYAAPGSDFRDFANDPPRSASYSNGDKRNGYQYEQPSGEGAAFTSHSRNSSFERLNNPRKDQIQTPALPYPVDDPFINMPNHEHYIDTPTLPNTQSAGRRAFFDEQTFSASSVASPTIISRPPLAPRSETTSTTSSISRDSNSSNGIISLPKSLPVCPRREYSKIYDDWYTLRDDKAFDVCPTCLEGIIRKSPFRLEFVPAPRRAPTVRTRCDFGSPWVRLAWLLTMKRQRKDLDLIYALSAISGVDSSCPDTKEGKGPWYGLLATDGQPIPGFAICSCDTKYIEACFPSLIGLFNRLPTSPTGRDANMCSMRVSGKRFATYLDLLEDMDEEARTMSLCATPSLQRLIRIIRADSPKKKCVRDTLLRDGTWHFMPSFPEFTVCEECFDDVIWPDIKQGSGVAERFNKVLKPLPAGVAMEGTSCHLYSPRMRHVWERAVRYGDKDGMIYLQRKIRERKAVEIDLREQQKEVARMLDRSKKMGGLTAAADKERFKRQLEDIELEWAEWE